MFHKAYSLEFIVRPIRRALPCANMRKAFSLLCEHALVLSSLGVPQKNQNPKMRVDR